jgi:hypothetical protein
VATAIQVYFCDPQHSWQGSSKENTNGQLRKYFPKGTDLSVYSQAKLNAVARRLNERPAKDTRLLNGRRTIPANYCIHRLNPPSKADARTSDRGLMQTTSLADQPPARSVRQP